MDWRHSSCIFLLVCQLCASQNPHQHRTQSADPQLHRNVHAGFCYSIPYGWVDRTREIGESPERDNASQPHAQVLLAVFERPPQAQTKELNSAVVIASEPVTAYPGLKTEDDYFGPLEEVTSSHGLQIEGEPYQMTINDRHLARADFTKQAAGTSIHQSTLVLLEKGSVLSFTFIAEDQDHVSNLIAGLRFGSCGKN